MSVTYVTRVLQMLEASRNAFSFCTFKLNTRFLYASGIAFNRVLQSIIEVLEVQLDTRFAVNNRTRVLQSIIES